MAKGPASIATAGTSTMMPSGGRAHGDALRRELGDDCVEQRGGAVDLLRHRHHRQHDLERCHGPRRGRARAAGRGRRRAGRSDRRMPRVPRNGLDSPSMVRPGDRLVAAGIEGAEHDGLRRRPFERCGDRRGTGVSSSGMPPPVEEELGADQADAVADRRVEPVEFLRLGDIDHHRDRNAVAGARPGAARPRPRLGAAGCFGAGGLRSADQCSARGLEDDAAGIAVDDRSVMAGEIERAEADDHRHAARAGEHGDMARRAAGEEGDAAAAAPVDARGSASASRPRR